MSVKKLDNGKQAIEQVGKFRDAARELACDEGESRWEANLRKVAKHKPAVEADDFPEEGEE